jgi:predicted dehydrogenase
MIEGTASGANIRKLRYAMVGGGPGAFIGDVHRKAIAMDGLAGIVAGCFSRSFEGTRATGEALGLPPERLYRTAVEMLEAEARREDRPHFVVIVTPNDAHYPVARRALELGFPVVCDKPLATSSRDAKELARLAAEKKLLFCVAYAYSASPLVKHIRDLIAAGDIGAVRFVNAEYPQEWLATALEEEGQKQAAWRTDPARAGISNCVGDIGSHIENMVAHMTGLRIARLSARLDRFGDGRALDDNATILVDYEGGARGVYWSSQIAVGHDNDFRVRIYGTKGSIAWVQEDPNHARVTYLDRPSELLSRGRDPLSPRARGLSRIPSGHPEGYFECFANLYSTYITALAKTIAGETPAKDDLDFPSVEEGVRGVKYIEACVASSARDSAWIEMGR